MNIKQFLTSLPEKVHPAAIKDVNTLFHFDMGDGPDDKYTVEVTDGNVKVTEGLNGDPKCTVKASEDTLTRLINKDLNPMTAMMTGKIKISNIGELMKHAKTLGIL